VLLDLVCDGRVDLLPDPQGDAEGRWSEREEVQAAKITLMRRTLATRVTARSIKVPSGRNRAVPPG
jgi:hypothetical protein